MAATRLAAVVLSTLGLGLWLWLSLRWWRAQLGLWLTIRRLCRTHTFGWPLDLTLRPALLRTFGLALDLTLHRPLELAFRPRCAVNAVVISAINPIIPLLINPLGRALLLLRLHTNLGRYGGPHRAHDG
ncbi:hypothetical protein ACVBEH_15510 [Roseateles sp. GG27B]